jgi:microsomal epoxide hydrolase
MLRPFEVSVPGPVLDDLARRLQATRFPPDDTDAWDAGMNPAYLRRLVGYWRDGYDWRKAEARLNRFHHFRGEVDGTVLHLVHEKGRGPSPLPLLLSHGYPDSFFRFDKLIPMLTDPAAHGGDPRDSFDVVVPSLPGYGFSEQRSKGGGIFGMGDLFHTLMTKELGYPRFGAHGGDWGSTITEHLARSHASSVVAIHLTDVPFWHSFQAPRDVDADERKYLDGLEEWQRDKGAYAMIQGTRPRTPAAGLSDSPAGLAAWLVEKFQEWSDCGDDVERSFTRDELLTNVMLYWVTGTIGTSFQPYHDVMNAGGVRWMKEVAKQWLGSAQTPAAFANFPKDLSHPPRRWAERFFNVQRWTDLPRGGHFAALEVPELLVHDIREFFRPFRRSG